MKNAVIAWPKFSTVRLIYQTYRLWIWGLIIVAVQFALPFQTLLDAITTQKLPGYASGIALLVLSFLIGQIPGWFFNKSIYWGLCNRLLVKVVRTRNLEFSPAEFTNIGPQRVKGRHDAWRGTMDVLDNRISSTRAADEREIGPQDAAFHVVPWTVAGGILCVGALLGQWAWPILELELGLGSLALAILCAILWPLTSLLLGAVLALAIAPWIR